MKKIQKSKMFNAIIISLFIFASFSTIADSSESNAKEIKIEIIKNTPRINDLLIEKNPVTNQFINNFNNNNYTSYQVTENGSHPNLGRENTGDLLAAYENPLDDNIVWTFSVDDGVTWDAGVHYSTDGIDSYPIIDYRGVGKKFAGTFQGDPNISDGAIQYLFMCDDPSNTNTYELSYWDWSAAYPYSNRRIPAIGGYDIGIPWWYGINAVVGTRADPGSSDMPIVNYANYNDDGSAWSTYFSEYSGCENVAVNIDLTNGYFYIVYDYLDDSDWDLLILRGDCHNDGSGHPIWFGNILLGGTENTKYPTVSVHENHVIILTQSDETGTQDIICYYSSDAGDTWDQSIVANDVGSDEVYPSIESHGLNGSCSFVKNGNLYASITDDGGVSWSVPVKINEEEGGINEEYKCADLCDFGLKSIYEELDGVYVTDVRILEPNLTCFGELEWTDVVAGSIVNGTIYVENIGGSLLDWEIDSYPSWGSWTFEPENGTGLPVGSQQIVNVELIAPLEPNQHYTGTVKIINSINPLDFCTIDASLTTLPATPDLDCSGILSWSDVTPGETVTGTITVENIGESLSLLDWEITEYPEWGTWTFIPDSGVDLTPEDGPETIGVSVVAPDEENQDFSGHITIVNIEDGSNFCIIDVSLATPVSQQISIYSLLHWFLERFPIAFPIFRYLLGL